MIKVLKRRMFLSIMGDETREECGVIGVELKKHISEYPEGGATHHVYRGLNSLQHRGQLSAGSVSYDPSRRGGLRKHVDLGEVREVFRDRHEEEHNAILKENRGTKAQGHVRYATSGARTKPREILVEEASPRLRQHIRRSKEFGFGLNGNIANQIELTKLIEEKSDYHLKTEVDAELIEYFLALSLSENITNVASQIDFTKVLGNAMSPLDGAYSVVFLNGKGDLVAWRDPNGFKPLCYGEDENIRVVASESVALIKLGIKPENIRDVKPGHFIHSNGLGFEEKKYADIYRVSHCMFEWVYFANPASILEGILVNEVRRRLGVELAGIEPLVDRLDESYVVTAVPNTSIPAAQAMAHKLGLEYRTSMLKNFGRTFIDSIEKRKRTLKDKYTFIPGSLDKLKVIVTDDSIVRGSTIEELINYIRNICGATEVHVRSSCPPLKFPCFYGIDFPTMDELIANRFKPTRLEEKLAVEVGADSLRYQTMSGLIHSIGLPKNILCLACLNSDYPTSKGQERYQELVV
jgi:amidophosphoribosyltransferase